MSRKNSKKISCKDFADVALAAVRLLAEPVKATLGPDGLPILLERHNESPLITKDGVTVANSIFVDDPVADTIIQAVKEASTKTGEMVGDGTTTAIVLTEALIEKGYQFIKAGLITPQALILEIKKQIPSIIENLQKMRKEISSEDQIRFVASISSNSDSEIAEKVTEAMMRCGKDGLFQIEMGTGAGIEVTQKDGYQIRKGWDRHKEYAVKMITDQLSQSISFENEPRVLLYNGDFSDQTEFGAFIMAANGVDTYLQQAKSAGQIVVVAHSFSGPIRHLVSDNWKQHGLPIMLVETEQMGTPLTRVYMLDDLAAYTGGMVVQAGHIKEILVRTSPTSEAIAEGVLGVCSSVQQFKSVTTFKNLGTTQDGILAHVEFIRAQMAEYTSQADINNHKMRMARLTNGLIVISVGGMTELEVKERRDRVDDAVQATRAAIKEGIVPGGGVALLSCRKDVFDSAPRSYGDTVLEHMFQAPIRQIIKNGGESPDRVLAKLEYEAPGEGYSGYDALNRTIIADMVSAGIIDPYLVVKTAFENAISIGCEILRGGGYVVYAKDQSSGMGPMVDVPESLEE